MRAILIVLILTFGSQAGAGGYLQNRSDWIKFDLKDNYVIGVFDWVVIVEGQPGTDTYDKPIAILNCARTLKLDSNSLVEIVNNYYEDVSTWKHPPSVALWQGLKSACEVR